MAGGQALHLFDPRPFIRPGTARPFRGTDKAAHFLDQDLDRLIRTAKKLGVRVIKVDHEGTKRQHIDLVAGPLRRAIAMAGES